MTFRKLLRPVVALGLAALLASCATTPTSDARYTFYLHGRIIEEQGPNAVSERFGRYDYHAIVGELRESGFEVVSEVRPAGTQVRPYAENVAADVEAVINRGVPPSHITVIGASKGAVIASLVSARLQHPRVRYVLLAGCNDALVETLDPRLTGEVLSIYEQSDEIAGSCKPVAERSSGLTRFEEIRLDTGLAHGFVYGPLDAWVAPAVQWANR